MKNQSWIKLDNSHADDYDDFDDYQLPPSAPVPGVHQLDDDACCIKCGFDSAEFWHWKKYTYEGQASDAKEPRCPK